MIVIATQCYPPRVGGIENLLYGLSAALFSRGHQIIVFADSHGDAQEFAFDDKQGFIVKRHSGMKFLRRRKKARDISLFIQQNKPLAIICDSWKSLELLRSETVPAVLCLAHGTELPVQCSRAKVKRIEASLTKATAVIANSHYTASRTKPFLANPAQLHVINPGINTPTVADKKTRDSITARLNQHSPILISVARLEKHKGLDNVLRLLPRLINACPKLIYIVVGEGPEQPTLLKLVKELCLEHHVLLTGTLSEQDRNAYLSLSDVFVMPGKTTGDNVEGFGIAYIEAAYFGVPAIASLVGGAAEAVINEHTGLVCQANDQEGVFNALIRLLKNEALRRSFGENAKQRAQILLWPNVIKKYEGLLDI